MEPILTCTAKSLWGSVSILSYIGKLALNPYIFLGTVAVPNDPATYMKFIEDIKSVQNILMKANENKDVIFVTLKALYDEISNQNKTPSPVMSIVLQLISIEVLPGR